MLVRSRKGDHGGEAALTAHHTACQEAAERRSAYPAPRRKRAMRGSGGRRKSAAVGSGMVETALAAFAHEVRTPLTGILAISNLLATSDLDERERRWVDTIKAGAEHLASLATLFVDAARSGGPGLSVRQDFFDLRTLARNAGDSLTGRAAAKGLQSSVEHFREAAGICNRRSRPPARRGREPDRQCGEVHRAGQRRAGSRRCAARRARSPSLSRYPTAESASSSARSNACSGRSRRPMSRLPRVSAAPVSDCRRSGNWRARWAATSR